MAGAVHSAEAPRAFSTHGLGVACGLAAGVWLGGAEAPAKLVSAGISPFTVSLCMVMGVFAARWTIPSLLKGTSAIGGDLRERPHLIVWGVLAGALWAVANTLTIFAIRNVGLAIAFPLWNTNSLVGMFWGWALFREMRGAAPGNWAKVVGGALAILIGAVLLAFSSIHATASGAGAGLGIAAALAASLLWGSMYIPYRKAYLSGMNPLSFVTVFTVGELGTMLVLAAAFGGGLRHASAELVAARGSVFWLFLGGFCWVIGDLFQQFATKYVGIGRAIPLSTTNQLWGLAWGALVFGELATATPARRTLILAGSLIMLAGALAISTAAAGPAEHRSTALAIARECDRYRLDPRRILAEGSPEAIAAGRSQRRWWDYAIAAAATAVFVWLARLATRPPLAIRAFPAALLILVLVLSLAGGAAWLWRQTRFC